MIFTQILLKDKMSQEKLLVGGLTESKRYSKSISRKNIKSGDQLLSVNEVWQIFNFKLYFLIE